MTTVAGTNARRSDPTPDITAVLRDAALYAMRAPSVHNTQPWHFDLHGGELEMHADPSRQLKVLDPARRQLTISCGCALFNARVGIAARGWTPLVNRLPTDGEPNLMARIGGVEPTSLGGPLAVYEPGIERRQTNRRRFSDNDVPADVVDALVCAAALEGAELVVVRTEEHRLALARLARQADDSQLLDPAYRAELRAWTRDPPGRDGVPARTVPHVDGTAHDEIPMRDFDTHGMGWLPAGTHSSRHLCLLLVCTDQDTVPDWLEAGEALERVLLELTLRGYVASLLTQVIEVAGTRAALRHDLGLTGHPQVLLRVGRAASTAASGRRRIVDVLSETP